MYFFFGHIFELADTMEDFLFTINSLTKRKEFEYTKNVPSYYSWSLSKKPKHIFNLYEGFMKLL